MKTITLNVPAMYADHHVIEVRRLLLELPGVESVNASSSFRLVEISFDPALVAEEQLTSLLGQAGYLEEMAFPVEAGVASYLRESGDGFTRHTAVYENTRKTVSFAQDVGESRRPLWPCPGFGVLKSEQE